MKRFVLLLWGLLLFPLGWLVNWLVMNVSSRWLGWYGVITLAVWFFLAYRFSRFNRNTVEAVLMLNLPAAIVLILLAVQHLIFHAYWMNPVGIWTQMFYLPVLFWGTQLSVWTPSMLLAYCVCFVLLVAAALLGCITYKRRGHYKKYH